jgi:hypothetical protein
MGDEEKIDRKIYVIDANVLIQAHRAYYAFDICPGFWDALRCHHSNFVMESIDKIKDEISEGDHYDNLKVWVKNTIPPEFFCSTDDENVREKYREIIRWVQAHEQFTTDAKAKFADDADGWLVAYAMANNRTLVTQEVFAADVKVKIPIPNICREFHVPQIDTFVMLRELGTEFSFDE